MGTNLKNELPVFDNMDAYIDYILPYIKLNSEDLSEHNLYLNKRWKEFRDEDDFHEAVLFIFQNNPEQSLLLSIDGNIGIGKWQVLDGTRTLIIEMGGAKQKSELYDLAFLSKDFLILKKHGNQKRIAKNKYLMLGLESSTGRLDWLDLMEKLFESHRKNWVYSLLLLVFLVFLGIIMISIFL